MLTVSNIPLYVNRSSSFGALDIVNKVDELMRFTLSVERYDINFLAMLVMYWLKSHYHTIW